MYSETETTIAILSVDKGKENEENTNMCNKKKVEKEAEEEA